MEDCNLLGAWMPPAKPAATFGADRGTGQPSTLDPKYAQRRHIVSSVNEGKESDSDSFLRRLERFQRSTESCITSWKQLVWTLHLLLWQATLD